jgi:hypothetical protein
LSGAAQKTYQDLTADQEMHYKELKKEILSRYGYTLIRLAKSWLTAEPLMLTPIEKVVIDTFLRSIQFKAKTLAS